MVYLEKRDLQFHISVIENFVGSDLHLIVVKTSWLLFTNNISIS